LIFRFLDEIAVRIIAHQFLKQLCRLIWFFFLLIGPAQPEQDFVHQAEVRILVDNFL